VSTRGRLWCSTTTEEVDCTYMQLLTSTRVYLNRLNKPEVRRQSEYDSHRFPPTGSNRRIDSTLRPTTFYLQGNDARLQLVPAPTTTMANGANKMICGTADHRSGKHRSACTISTIATTAGSAAEHTTIEIDCRVCSDHHQTG
jgi:hypothetical protein